METLLIIGTLIVIAGLTYMNIALYKTHKGVLKENENLIKQCNIFQERIHELQGTNGHEDPFNKRSQNYLNALKESEAEVSRLRIVLNKYVELKRAIRLEPGDQVRDNFDLIYTVGGYDESSLRVFCIDDKGDRHFFDLNKIVLVKRAADIKPESK